MCLEQEHKPKSKNTKLKSRNHKPRNTNPATDLPCQPNTKATNTNPATELKQVKPRWWKEKKKKTWNWSSSSWERWPWRRFFSCFNYICYMVYPLPIRILSFSWCLLSDSDPHIYLKLNGFIGHLKKKWVWNWTEPSQHGPRAFERTHLICLVSLWFHFAI